MESVAAIRQAIGFARSNRPFRALAVLALPLCALTPAARASDFSLYTGIWDYGVGGNIASQGSSVSLDSDDGIKANPQVQALLHYGGRGGWLPDLSAGYVHLGAAGQYLANTSFQFAGIDIISGKTTVQAGINLNDFDGSLDWRLLYQPRYQLEAGVEGKYLAGQATVIGNTAANVIILPISIPTIQQRYFSIDKLVPLAHLRAQGSPWPWLRLELSGGYIVYEGQHVGEVRAVADVHVWKPVFITAGYQEQAYKVKESPYLIHARVDGPTIGITVATP